MLNIPDSIKALYQRDDVQKNFRVQFPNGELPDITNENVVAESVRLTESLCSQEVLKFGLTEAPVIEFETVGVANMYGMKIECFSEIDTSSLTAEDLADIQAMTDLDGELVLEADSDLGWGFYRLPLGVFHVDSCPRSHGQMSHRQVVAYGSSFPGLGVELPNAVKKSELIINPAAYWEASTLRLSEMTETTFNQGNLFRPTNSAGTKELHIRGIGYYSGDSDVIYDAAAKVAVYVDCPAHEYDSRDKSKEFYTSALRNIPSGYNYSGSNNKITNNSKQSFMLFTGYCLPFVTIVAYYDGGNKSVISYPFSIEPNKMYVFDLQNVTSILKYTGALESFIVRVSVPRQWQSHASWEIYGDGTIQYIDIQNWPIEPDPVTGFTTVVERCSANDIHIYWKTLSNTDNTLDVKVKKTGDVSYPSVGKVYDYNDAFDFEQFMQGYLELMGTFGNQRRDGGYREISLTNNDFTEISSSLYSELWWDEYDVSPIGSVSYKIGQDKDDVIVHRFNDGLSAYDMTDNYVIQNMSGAKEETINQLLNTYFVPNIKDVYYTPTTLDMKCLPYLEAGDIIAINPDAFIGKNLLRGTDSFKIGGGSWLSGTWDDTSQGEASIVEAEVPSGGTRNVIRFRGISIAQYAIPLTPGTVTLSLYIRVIGAAGNTFVPQIRLENADTGEVVWRPSTSRTNCGTEWVKISRTADLSAREFTKVNLYINFIYTAAMEIEYGEICDIMLNDGEEEAWEPSTEYVVTPIMRRTMNGIQSLTETIESSGGEIISNGYYITEVESNEQST